MICSKGVGQSRREFFRAGARYAVLGMLAVVAVVTGTRRLRGQRCINQGLCGGCAVFESCGLPQALSVKQAKGRGSV